MRDRVWRLQLGRGRTELADVADLDATSWELNQ